MLVALKDGPDGVRVTLVDSTGRIREVHAGYVVAADGAHSTIRSALGIAMNGASGRAQRIPASSRRCS